MDVQQVQTMDENALVDLFSTGAQTSQKNGVSFGQEETTADILTQQSSSTVETTTIAPVDTTSDSTTETTTKKPEDIEDPNKQADILEAPAKPGRKPKYDFSDISGYFQDRIKNKKFVEIQEEDSEGNKTAFIPKTPEEFDEVIDIQINHRLAQERKSLEKKIYESKSPAWKAVLQYAEMMDNPTEMLPFLQGVKTIQSVADMNPDEIEGAERIIRTRLEHRGDPDEVIDSQIEALKTTDKLISTAKQYKPVILQQEQKILSEQIQQQRQREQEYIQMVTEIREDAVKAIDLPIFGKTKLKQEEKAIIYDLIAEPASDTQGYGIYTAIDQLFEKRDFEKLRKIALLLAKEESFLNYFGSSVANNTAASLQRTLMVAGESRQASGKDFDEEETPVVQRNQYPKQVRFGK